MNRHKFQLPVTNDGHHEMLNLTTKKIKKIEGGKLINKEINSLQGESEGE